MPRLTYRDHVQSYNKAAMKVLTQFLMSCAALLKKMTGDLQLNKRTEY